MLNHIVSWKMNGETASQRAAQATEVAEALRALVGVVPTIAHLEVHLNELEGYNNWDVVLVSQFSDADALAAYVTHPEHQKVVEFIKARAVARAGVDYTV